MPKLVGGKALDAGALADTPDHPHQRLSASRRFWILQPPDALVLRHPLLDLDVEDVIVRLWLEAEEGRTKLARDIGIEREPVPVLALPTNPDASAHKVEVGPLAADDLRPSQADALHQQ